jgi:formylmethanofuran dehydrogenase subunit C
MAKILDTGEQFDAGVGSREPTPLSFAGVTSAELHHAIHAVPLSTVEEELARIQLTGAAGQPYALMRLNHAVQIHVDGSLGDYACAHNAQADVRIDGSVGHGVGEGMLSGSIRVRGDAGVGGGVAMQGGTLAIYGSAGDRLGAAMRGGGVFVRGNAGDDVGIGALRGTIVIGGNAGRNLGDAMNNVTIFLRGKAKSLSAGVTEAPLRKREQLKLGLLLLNASIRGDAKEFRRIVPAAMLRAEEAARGEINPHWR